MFSGVHRIIRGIGEYFQGPAEPDLEHPTSPSELLPQLKTWQDSTYHDAPKSLELWASGKFIGRECASISHDYIACKMEKGEHPGVCINHAKKVSECTLNV